jgi:putative ABC transport system permease protein
MPVPALLSQLMLDIRYGARMLRKSPGFTAVTVVTLALGIGANTAIFSVVDSVLLRPLPYKDPGRLFVVWEKPPKSTRNVVSAANFLDWREQNRVFENLVGTSNASFNLAGKDSPERVDGMRVSHDFFAMLGISPVLGRAFTPEDDRAGAPRAVILSHGLWQRRFASDPGVAGRSISVDGQPTTVVGILPERFGFFGAPEMWMPLALDRSKVTRDFHYLVPIARLKAGVSLEQARSAMQGVAAVIERDYPKSNKGWSVTIEPLRDAVVGGQRDAMIMLFAAVVLVLLIACVNVANLQLAKAATRQRELAVRASIGAGRGRLMRQLLAESVLLASLGGALGLLLALFLTRVLRSLVPPFLLAGIAEVAVDWRVLGFTFGLSILTGLVFGAAPAWWATRLNVHQTLKEGGRGSGGGFRHARVRNALVVAEVALSVVLLVSAGLMIRSLSAMAKVDPGFRPDHVLTMRLAMADGKYPGGAAVRGFYARVLERVENIPGVKSASLSMGLPLRGTGFGMPFLIASHPKIPISEAPGVPFELASHGYFRTLGIALRKGRLFGAADNEGAPRVAIVNETFARRFLTKEEPLGQRLLVEELITGKRELGAPIAWEIVGVVADAKFGGLNDTEQAPVIYVPLPQSPWPSATLSLRTATEPMSLAKAVRAALTEIDSEMPVTRVRTMEQIVVESMSQSRMQTWLIGIFGAVALALSALGIYGVISYSVTQGTHDMGIRMALGAKASDVLRTVLRNGMVLVALGTGIGVAGAFAATRLLSSLLFGVGAGDPGSYAAVVLLLGAVALAAAFIPARRATRIDPITALRLD